MRSTSQPSRSPTDAVITVKDGWRGLPEEQGFLRDVQAAACQQFSTVLAPGSNAYHYDHIHVDLMRRASRRVVCEPQAVSGEEIAARIGCASPLRLARTVGDGIARREEDRVASAQQRADQRRRRIRGRIKKSAQS